MPLYEYQCEHCGERFEKIQKFSDPPLDTCPKCGGGPVHKLIAAPAFQFKGTGWYITDYARKDAGGGKAEASKDSSSQTAKPADSDSGNKDAGKKEEKPAKTDSKGESKSTSSDSNSTPKSA